MRLDAVNPGFREAVAAGTDLLRPDGDIALPEDLVADFRNEFNIPAKIANVIRSGSVIGRAPIVSMPHWGGILPARDVQALIAYLATLQ